MGERECWCCCGGSQTEPGIVVDKCLLIFLAIIKSPVDLCVTGGELGQETELRIEIVC